MALIYDLRDRLENLRNNFSEVMKDLTNSVALNGKAIAEKTILEEGFGATYNNLDYIDKRRKKGLTISHVTLNFTNEMWSGMHPSDVEQNGYIFKSYLTHNNEAGLHKMRENYMRYGNYIYIALNKGDNADTLQEIAGYELNRFINKYIQNE